MSHKAASSQIDGKVYHVTIEAHILTATTSIKFPCLFYILWKTNDHQYTVETNKHSPQGTNVPFQEKITLKVPLVYERTKQIFLKKETQVQLNLVSKNRPDQPKLVGRVTIDIAALLNDQLYKEPTQFTLQFCSVNASLTTAFRVLEQVQTDSSIYQLEKSLGDATSFSSGLKGLHIHTFPEKSRDQLSFGKEIPPKTEEKTPRNLQMTETCTSPKAPSPVRFDREAKERIQMSSSTSQRNKVQSEEKQTAKSLSGAKVSGIHELYNNNKKQGSVLSDESKLGEEVLKLQRELDSLRQQSNRQLLQAQKSRKQLQGKLKDVQFTKLELRQKQTVLDQTSSQNNYLRNQSARLKEEITKLLDEAVSHTISMAELKDNYNRVSAQLSTAQKELKRNELTIQQIRQTNEELNKHIQQLQTELDQAQSQYRQLEKQMTQRQGKWAQQSKEHDTKLEQQIRLTEQANQQIVYLEQQLESLKGDLEKAKQLQEAQETRLLNYEEEVSSLTAVQAQYEEAKKSWETSQGITNQELTNKDVRINELQDTLVSISQRLKSFEDHNAQLEQQVQKQKIQLLSIQQTRLREQQQAQSKQKELINQIQEERSKYENTLLEKHDLQVQLESITAQLQSQTKDYQSLLASHQELTQKYTDLQNLLLSEKNKTRELEQVILSGNEQKQRQLFEASERQNTLQIRVQELSNDLQNAEQRIFMVEQKLSMTEEELKGRQDLIIKLQEGFNTQIQRTESLNAKLITYFEKDEKLKDLTLLLQQEEKKICELLVKQQESEEKNYKLIREREQMIGQLTGKLEDCLSYGKALEKTLEDKQRDYQSASKLLQKQIVQLTTDRDQLVAQNEQHLLNIQGLSSDLVESQKQRTSDLEAKESQLTEAKHVNQKLQQQKVDLELAIGSLQAQLADLKAQKESLQTQLIQENANCIAAQETVTIKETQIESLKTNISTLEARVTQLQQEINELENQISIREELLQQENHRYTQLQKSYDLLANDTKTFDILQHKQAMEQKNTTIHELQIDLNRLRTEAARIPAIERALKIKTIQLNSIKFKSKGQIPETNELIKLKDEEITALQSEKQHLLTVEKQFIQLQQEVSALRQQLEIIEEERFNIESQSNERALQLEEAKEENKKLIDQITIIGEKHGQLQKVLCQMVSNEATEGDIPKTDSVLRAQNLAFKAKTRQYQSQKSRPSIVNVGEALRQLSNLYRERGSQQLQENLLACVRKDRDISRQQGYLLKAKALSRDFTRLKTQLLKVSESKSRQERANLIQQVQICEKTIEQLANFSG